MSKPTSLLRCKNCGTLYQTVLGFVICHCTGEQKEMEHDEMVAVSKEQWEKLNSFNLLSPAEVERLAMLAEESGEVIQIIGKILRHGYESTHPGGGPTNRHLLERELGDVDETLRMMKERDDIDEMSIRKASSSKRERVAQYLHHQEAQ